MRKILPVVLVALVVVVGYAGWRVARHLLHDPVAAGAALYDKGELHGASLELRNAVREHPQDARAHVLLAKVQLRLGDPVAAENELKQAIALRYPGPELTPLLARAYLGERRFRDLLRDIPADAGKLPAAEAAQVLVARSQAQIALGDAVSARASASAAERLDPKLAEAPLAAARVLFAEGEAAPALVKVDDALRLDPKLLQAFALKADIQQGRGDTGPAVATLDQAVAIAPAQPGVRLARARLLLLLGEDDKASADLDVALKAEPNNAAAHFLRALLLVRARDWKAADVEMQKIQPLLGRLPRGEYYAALVKANINQPEQAAEQIAHYTAHAPQDPDGFRLAARIDLLMDRQKEAQQALRRVAALGGAGPELPAGASAQLRAAEPEADSPEGLTRLAARQIDEGDTADAARGLEQSLESRPKPERPGPRQVLAALAAGAVGRAQAALGQMAGDPGADPETVANLTGLVRFAALDFDGARAAWQDAVKRWPEALPIKLNLARVLALTGDRAGSEKLLAGVLAAQPAAPQALRMMVRLLLAQHRTGEAIGYVQAARRAAPNVISLLVTEAALHTIAGDFPAAYATLDQVPLEAAQSPLLLGARAEIELAQGRLKDASDSLRQILLGHPDDQATRRRLIGLLIRMKQPAEALRLAREGLARDPGNSALMDLQIDLVRATGGLDAALAEAAALRRDPVDLPAARLLAGALYVGAKRYGDAVAAYREEMKDAPFSALVLATARALQADGHADEGVAMMRDWVAKAPDAAVSDALASLDIAAGRLGPAAADLRAVLAQRPTDAAALNNLAWVFQQQHDPEALGLARRAYLLAPTPQAADTLGWILVQQGKPEVGLALLRQAAAALRDPAVVYHLAVALKATGQRDEAARLLAALLDTPAKFDERDAALKLQAELGGPPAATQVAAPAPAK